MSPLIRTLLGAAIALVFLAGPAPKPTASACTGVAPATHFDGYSLTSAAVANVVAFENVGPEGPGILVLRIEDVIGGRWATRTVRYGQEPGCARGVDVRRGQRVVIARVGLPRAPERIDVLSDPLWPIDANGRVVRGGLSVGGRPAPSQLDGLRTFLDGWLRRSLRPDRDATLTINVALGYPVVSGRGSPGSRHRVIWRSTSGGLFETQARGSIEGDWSVCLPGGPAPGDHVGITVGARSHAIDVAPVDATLDDEADVATGHAPPTGEVKVGFQWPHPDGWLYGGGVEGVADADGRFELPLGVDVTDAFLTDVFWIGPEGDEIDGLVEPEAPGCAALPDTAVETPAAAETGTVPVGVIAAAFVAAFLLGRRRLRGAATPR